MRVIRYSQGFKIKLVREAEEEGNYPNRVSRKYGVEPKTVMRWVRQYGSGKHGKVIRVEKADEVNETARLRRELRVVKEALADAHVALAVEKAYVDLACEQMGQSPEGWRKKQDGRPRSGRSKPNRSSR
ncbi:MAG TPA: transposase [Pyrinomonadaceae bacterium]